MGKVLGPFSGMQVHKYCGLLSPDVTEKEENKLVGVEK